MSGEKSSSGLNRSRSMRLCNLKNEHLTRDNPFLSTINWQSTVSATSLSSGNVILKTLSSKHNENCSQTSMISSSELNTHNRYFSAKLKNEAPSVPPIFQSVFMRPQVINLAPPTASMSNLTAKRTSLNPHLSTSSLPTSSSSASPSQSGSSSLSTTPNDTDTNVKKIPIKPNSPAIKSAVSNQIETLLDSKKAREAFFERIRAETLKVKTVSPRSSTSRMDVARSNEGKLERIISAKPPPRPQNFHPLSAKPFDPKRNFSNVVKIDKKFIGENDSTNSTPVLKSYTDNPTNGLDVCPFGEDKQENNMKKLKSLLTRRLSLNNDRRFQQAPDTKFTDHQTRIIKLDLIGANSHSGATNEVFSSSKLSGELGSISDDSDNENVSKPEEPTKETTSEIKQTPIVANFVNIVPEDQLNILRVVKSEPKLDMGSQMKPLMDSIIRTPVISTPNDEENEAEQQAGFSDDELDEIQTIKDRNSISGATTAMSQRQISSSKVSLTESSLGNTAATFIQSSSEENSSDEESDSASDESLADQNLSVPDVLSKYGFDYKSLFATTVRSLDNGSSSRLKPPLIESLFANVPPVINFVTLDDKINEMPDCLKRLCKWKMCSITPNIVKQTIIRSNFRLSTHKHDWLGVWGSHMKPECFRSIKEYQKINHFPGSFQIGRKDRLCRNLYHAQAVFGKTEYNFVPMTFVLPSDYLLLKTEVESKNIKWILKPPASARGQGIRVVSKLDQIPKKRACVVQKYLSNPYLIDGLKFDLRIYVYVTSYDPLRIYLFNDGLTRFASRKYSNSVKTIGDKFMHLTNYSINKTNKEYKSNDDEKACVGHKWTLKALWVYLQKKGVNTDKVWENIVDLVIKTIICGDPHVNVLVKTNLKRKYSVHELFGFDVILDENLKPWIVEVNISPSLHSNSPLDVSVKGQMIADLFNLAGFMLPNPKEFAKTEGRKTFKKIPKCLTFNKSLLPQNLSNDERAKHQFYVQRQADEKTLSTILDVLTPDDLRILIESEDEFNRRGNFTRIFPTANTKSYLKFFETSRYYNLLLNEWLVRFRNHRDKAINLLNFYCKKKIHLQNPTSSVDNQWSPMKTLKSATNNENRSGLIKYVMVASGVKSKTSSAINFHTSAKEQITVAIN